MKRIILIFAAILLLLPAAEAQYSQGVLTETTTVTRTKIEKPKKERQKFDAKRGYQQEASIGCWWSLGNKRDYLALRFSYIGGMRFNNYFFAGIGTGLDIGLSNIYNTGLYIYCSVYHGTDHISDMPMQIIAIPLFANIKVYFSRTQVAPYLSFSAGARFSSPKKAKVDGFHIEEKIIKYGAVKPFFEVNFGLDIHCSQKHSYILQFGYYVHGVTSVDVQCKDYVYYEEKQNSFDHGHGLSVSFGMTF